MNKPAPGDKMTEGVITPEALEAWKERIGVSLRISHVFNRNVTEENIRNYVNGIGDINPLYRDEEYVKTTAYPERPAPPGWLYSVFPTWVLQGLKGVHAFHSGNEWKFYRPLFLHDTVAPECIFTGFDVKGSRFAGKTVIEYQQAGFTNQKSQLVAEANSWLIRAERRSARKSGKYKSVKLPHPWSRDELERIESETLSEEARGADPRYWEDVAVGDELKPVVRGPLGLTDTIAYCIGATPVPVAAHGVQLRRYAAHPALAFRDPRTSALEPVSSVHYNETAAQAVGVPFPYDEGAQRNGWLFSLLTSWMGDDGWLKYCYAEYRGFVYFSDVVWLSGSVTRKYIDADGDCCVDIRTRAVNQRGEDTMPGLATVALPGKAGNARPVETRCIE